MAQTEALVAALKDVLKARGMTYARVAKGLGLSEASVKRVFASRSFTLQRLDEVCALLGIDITDLAAMVRAEAETPVRLSLAQEKELVSDNRLLLVAVHALNGWGIDDILDNYELTRAECVKLLARLDRVGILELLPNNRIRIRVARDFAWLPDGPIQQYFRAQVQADFFRSRFDGEGELMTFATGMLTPTSGAALRQKLRQVLGEFYELHHQDLGLPLDQRAGTSLLLAVRPWMPETFKKLARPARSRPRGG
ncbi:MAG TPA: helix-turn-helix transcriptional regulator [Burkholderiales bacterium]|nr:helix-turn-helix transcriptional regulator [Burkholderiales bacterium]